MIDSGAGSLGLAVLLGVHVLAGVVALGAGFVALLTRKGGRRHNGAGKVYVLTMAIVVVTAIPLAIVATNPFLLSIAVFSGYLVFSGYRVVLRRRASLTAPTAVSRVKRGERQKTNGLLEVSDSSNRDPRRTAGPTAVDYAGHGTMAIVGTLMIVGGGWRTLTGPVGLAPALVAFGGVGCALAVSSVRQRRVPPAERSSWVASHVGFMGGAYIATVTAAITVNVSMVPPLVR